MRIVRLMPDYHCFPLWEGSPGSVGNIDPRTLPISNDLASDLLEWSAVYNTTLNMDDPLSSGFPSEIEEARFKKMGYKLGERLQHELENEWIVDINIEGKKKGAGTCLSRMALR